MPPTLLTRSLDNGLHLRFVSLRHHLNRQGALRRELGQNIIVKLHDVVQKCLYGLVRFFAGSCEIRFPDHALRMGHTLNPPGAPLAMPRDWITVRCLPPCPRVRQEEIPRSGSSASRACTSPGIRAWTSRSLPHPHDQEGSRRGPRGPCPSMRRDDPRYIQVEKHRRNLILLRKLIDRRRHGVFLAVEAEENLFAKARVPETGHHSPEIG